MVRQGGFRIFFEREECGGGGVVDKFSHCLGVSSILIIYNEFSQYTVYEVTGKP